MNELSLLMFLVAAESVAAGVLAFTVIVSSRQSGALLHSIRNGLPEPDKTFIHALFMLSYTEMSASRMALERSSDPGVIDYARYMLDDYAALLSHVKEVVPLHIDTADEYANKVILDRLKSTPGSHFNDAFVADIAVKLHRTAIASIARETRYGKLVTLRQLARQSLPQLREHVRRAQALQSREVISL